MMNISFKTLRRSSYISSLYVAFIVLILANPCAATWDDEDCGDTSTNALLGRKRDPMEKPLFNYAPIDE